MTMLTSLLTSTMESRQPEHLMNPPKSRSLQKLCLSVDYITDPLVTSISTSLPSQWTISLIHIDLQDAPFVEPTIDSDVTNNGLQQINQHGELKHMSLIRSPEFLFTYFRRVNDLCILLMVNTFRALGTIRLGFFCRVTDNGFRKILHSCPSLRKLRISHGSQLADLLVHASLLLFFL